MFYAGASDFGQNSKTKMSRANVMDSLSTTVSHVVPQRCYVFSER